MPPIPYNIHDYTLDMVPAEYGVPFRLVTTSKHFVSGVKIVENREIGQI